MSPSCLPAPSTTACALKGWKAWKFFYGFDGSENVSVGLYQMTKYVTKLSQQVSF